MPPEFVRKYRTMASKESLTSCRAVSVADDMNPSFRKTVSRVSFPTTPSHSMVPLPTLLFHLHPVLIFPKLKTKIVQPPLQK